VTEIAVSAVSFMASRRSVPDDGANVVVFACDAAAASPSSPRDGEE